MSLPAQQFLDRRGIPYQKLTFPPGTEKGAASVARALGYKESQMVKTLIFETDRDEKVLVMRRTFIDAAPMAEEVLGGGRRSS